MRPPLLQNPIQIHLKKFVDILRIYADRKERNIFIATGMNLMALCTGKDVMAMMQSRCSGVWNGKWKNCVTNLKIHL